MLVSIALEKNGILKIVRTCVSRGKSRRLNYACKQQEVDCLQTESFPLRLELLNVKLLFFVAMEKKVMGNVFSAKNIYIYIYYKQHYR